MKYLSISLQQNLCYSRLCHLPSSLWLGFGLSCCGWAVWLQTRARLLPQWHYIISIITMNEWETCFGATLAERCTIRHFNYSRCARAFSWYSVCASHTPDHSAPAGCVGVLVGVAGEKCLPMLRILGRLVHSSSVPRRQYDLRFLSRVLHFMCRRTKCVAAHFHE